MKDKRTNNPFTYKFYNTIMPFVYNIGAAVVIFGAMFKLLNLPGGNIMLGLGLSTEAFIFLLSAFEPKEEAVDWSRVYPELAPDYKGGPLVGGTAKTPHTIAQKFDQCLEKASIDISLLENLAAVMRRFSDNMANVPSFAQVGEVTEAYMNHVGKATRVIGDLAKVNDAVGNALQSFASLSSEDKLTHYFGQMEEMAHTLTSMNGLYKKALAHMEAQTNHTSTLYDHLETALKAMEVAGNEALHFKKELALLNEKMTALNEIYAKTLTAFKS
ncbi:MAG: gliding motility protein GldL [Candidatus Cardinium sp.]|uniref:type IX secretion system motor protein PorL/GldL n=1 Tax=Cardinium endosymbiont of Dermatophagoides farinae TaxID=2597823 RepID=UPI001183337F|nr:gliding motility protein GldL [Cardinium endosymbiont of Dermatophagoides farinae]TSJ81458.1 gliding motility protein GldL [Cardinium endosymbiont of Dermatophagoides farinae]UWW96437.1 MAG: gliding motility protein GldL [Candidatus Cardinium sp.]